MSRTRLRCPQNGCSYLGTSLKYHLLRKHKNDVDASTVDALVQIARNGDKTENKKGRRIRWCPIDGCHVLVSSIRPHLRRVHKIQNPSSLNELFRRSRLYEPNKLPVSVALPVPVWGYDVPRVREPRQVFESGERLMLLDRTAEKKRESHTVEKGMDGCLMRWCPIKDCFFTTVRMRRHLRKKHKITNDEWLDVLLKESPCCDSSIHVAMVEKHKTVRCPLNGCDYAGKNIKYHLLSKKHEDDVDASTVGVLTQMALKGNDTGCAETPMRWCPVDGCHKLVKWPMAHFRRAHLIANRRLLDDLMKRSSLYEPNKLPTFFSEKKKPTEDDNEPRCEWSVLDVTRWGDDTMQQPRVFEPMKALMLLACAAETNG